eukprot:gene2073-2559_t
MLIPGTSSSSSATTSVNNKLESSCVIDGFLYQSTFSYAGSEQLSKKIEKPKILLLNTDLELKHQKEYAKIEINDLKEYFKFIQGEKQLVMDQLENIYKKDVNIILDKKVIGDLATQEFTRRKNIHCSSRIDGETMKCLEIALGGVVQSTLNDLSNDDRFYGTCNYYKRVLIGKKSYELFSGCEGRFATIVLRGSSTRFLDEAVIGIQDAIKTIQTIIHDQYQVVCGAGSFEIDLSISLDLFLINRIQNSVGKEYLIVESIQQSLQDLVKLMGDNSGFDGSSLVDQLLLFHSNVSNNSNEKEDPFSSSTSFGIDISNGEICDVSKHPNLVLESNSVKFSILNSVIDTACLLLNIQ